MPSTEAIEAAKKLTASIAILPQAGGFSGSASASAPRRERAWHCPHCHAEGFGNVDGKTCDLCKGQMTAKD